jgi:hypothetical protein
MSSIGRPILPFRRSGVCALAPNAVCAGKDLAWAYARRARENANVHSRSIRRKAAGARSDAE